jgi:murein DD-endopeptidase MepM/ murein hydrolase activator NlpD
VPLPLVVALVTLLPGPARAAPASAAAPAAVVSAAAGTVGPATSRFSSRVAATRTAGGRWVAPLVGSVVVLRPFAPPPYPWLPGHRGVDLAASRGDVVRAAGAGTVTVAGDIAGRGVVVVTHPGGLRTTYEPAAPLVQTGDVVVAGEAIGTVADGAVHCGGARPCLHWGLRRGRDYLDPMLLITPMQAVLLPP